MPHRIYLAAIIVLVGNSAIAPAAEPFVLTGNDFAAKQPQLAVDSSNGLHLVFGSGSGVYHCSSRDGGQSFTDPVRVGGARFLSLGMRRGPRVAATGDAIVVTAIGGEIGGGRDGDLFAWRSTDNGKTWQGPSRVNDVDASAREGLHAMSASPAGVVYCAWLDLRNKRTEIMGASSRDGGKTWSENHVAYRSPEKSVCECCHPSVAFAADGTLYVMWRNSLAGNRDMYVALSKDEGRSFAAAKKLGTGNWQLDACPMDGGTIAIDKHGIAHTAWRRAKHVYSTSGETSGETSGVTSGETSGEQQLAAGEQPWLAMTDLGTAITWISHRPGDLFVKVPWKMPPTKLASDARDPVVVGCQDSVVVAWETEHDGKPLIKVQRIDKPAQ